MERLGTIIPIKKKERKKMHVVLATAGVYGIMGCQLVNSFFILLMFFPSNPELQRKERALKRLMRKADSAMQEASFPYNEKEWDKASLRYLNAVDAYNEFYRKNFNILYK